MLPFVLSFAAPIARGVSRLRLRVLASSACALMAAGVAFPAQAAEAGWQSFNVEAAPRAQAPAKRTKATASRVGATTFSGTGKMPWDEYDKLVKGSGVIGTLGPDLFGDTVEYYKNTLSFSVTDISLPGNFPLPVALTRKMAVSDRYAYDGIHDGALSDWDLDIPSISGVYAPAWGDDRCSFTVVPQPPTGSGYETRDFWNGLNANMPGGGELLRPIAYDPAKPDQKATPLPQNGETYPWVTPGLTVIRCYTLPVTANATGEGFEALTSDGTKYTFGWMATNYEPRSQRPAKTNDIGEKFGYAPLERRRNTMYVTKVEDRFGNTVTYTYDNAKTEPARLRSIQASDGRLITLAYTGNTLTSATAHGRTWTYQYNLGLSAVVLPDSSRWTYDFSGLSDAVIEPDTSGPRTCNMNAPSLSGGGTGTVTHPSGAIGTFTVGLARHGRTNVPKYCDNWSDTNNNQNDDIAVAPKSYELLAITRKTISGPGIVPYEWTFTGGGMGTWFPAAYVQGYRPVCQTLDCMEPVCVDDSCAGTHVTTIIGHEIGSPEPSTDFQRITFGNSYKYNEGKLLKVERGASASSILEVENHGYNLASTGQPFGILIGKSLQGRSAGWASERIRPESSKVITRDGIDFSWTVNTFDKFARPTVVDRTSLVTVTGPAIRTKRETTEYFDQEIAWVLGQVKKVSSDGIEVSRTDFDAKYRPWKLYSFGLLQQTLGYDDTVGINGTLKTVADGNTNTTTFSNWHRGIPRAMALADGKTLSAVVNDSGWITSVTDEMGTVTNYAYDTMGRLSTIDYTDADPVAWSNTNQSFGTIGTTEYGIPVGSWKQTKWTGNGRTTTWFNARWQPILVLTEDTANTATRSYVVTRYDAEGRAIFKSYPVATLSTIDDTMLAGVRTEFDALGRVTLVRQDSELAGLVETRTEYLTGFQTRVTNPRGFATTTEYQTYDTPSTDAPIRITAPETQLTVINRDPFGKPLSITRSGTYDGLNVSAARSYVYDAFQRLCKTVEPEAGATLLEYDAASNVIKTATGQALPALVCNPGAVNAADKTVRTYDALNRIKTVDVAGSTNDLAYTYNADGTLLKLENGDATKKATWDYTYNRRGMPVTETLTFGGLVRTLTHEYNTNGLEYRLTYPSGQVINTVPNALGQATQAATYATGVAYFPNGGMSGFTYGNGIVHAMTQNNRRLPLRSLDQKPGQPSVLDDNYTYDANGNVLSIVDTSGLGGGTRQGITYDGLDRLTAASSPGQSWSASMTYDPLDNLRTHMAGSRNWTYVYDANNRLDVLNNTTGGTVARDIDYDVRGNVTTNGADHYVFDQANRMTEVTGKERYFYDGHGRRVEIENWNNGPKSFPMYSLDGKLVADLDLRQPLDQVHEYYYLNGSQVARRYRQNVVGSAWTVRYVHTDSLGSGVVETKADASFWSATKYKPYGEPNAVRQGPGYTGHVTDAATGLSYMQQRYYDPVLGRFLSVDPMQADANTAWNFNRYNYAANNPLSNKDPDGRACDGGTPSACNGLAPVRQLSQQEAKAGAGLIADFTPVIGDAKGFYDAYRDPSAINIVAAVVGVVPVVGDVAGKAIKLLDKVSDAGKAAKSFSKEKQALVDMAKADKRTGISPADMQAYKELNKGLPDPFPTNKVRGPEAHQSGAPSSQAPHGHVGPVDHIPIKDPK